MPSGAVHTNAFARLARFFADNHWTDYLPIVPAASGATARSSSTTSMANIAVVNGPVRNEIDMDSGMRFRPLQSCECHDRSRLESLVAESSGRLDAGRELHGLTGNPLNYSACFAEAEERGPWVPLHVQKGMKPGDSALTIFFGAWHMPSGFGPRATGKSGFIGRSSPSTLFRPSCYWTRFAHASLPGSATPRKS